MAISTVSAEEIANKTDSLMIDESNDLMADDDNLDYDDYRDYESEGYNVGFFDNMSVVHLSYDEINWNVKNLTDYDEYYNETFYTYLSTFKLNGVEYTIEQVLPTAGVYDHRIFITFNPNEYDVYDGIFYKMDNGIIADIIGVEEYQIYDDVYYRHVGNGMWAYGDEDYNYYNIVNNECYENYLLDFFYKAVEGTDYKIVNGEYYTLDNEKIRHINEDDYYGNNYSIEFINDTYFITYYYDNWNWTYAEAIVNGAYLISDDGFYYYNDYPKYTLYFYDFIKLNNTFYKTVKGKSYNSTDDVWSQYALIDGKLYNLNLHYEQYYDYAKGIYASLGDVVDLTVDSNYTIIAHDVIKYFGGSERFSVQVINSESKALPNKEVKIFINGQEYARTTDGNGYASIGLNLNTGIYPAVVECDDVNTKATVTIKATIDGKDITKIFRNDTQYYATFLDTRGNLLKNKEVSFNINGAMYYRTTDDKGVARLNINLGQGNYILTAINPISGEQKANNITVLPSIIENDDITKYYKNGTQYVVKVLNLDGSVAGAGVNVTFNINGVFYTRTTNASGYAKLNINLAPEEYTITAEYNALRVSNKIKVLPVLSAEDLIMSFRDGSKFEAKLVDGQGNVYASQTIKFNINGVFYDRTTDANGIAKLNINLMSGKYIITSMYNGAAISNEVTISG